MYRRITARALNVGMLGVCSVVGSKNKILDPQRTLGPGSAAAGGTASIERAVES